MAEELTKTSWKTISSLVGRKHKVADRRHLPERIAAMVCVSESRVTVGSSTMVPPDLAERLTKMVNTLPHIKKRHVMLTGLAQTLDICERSSTQPVTQLKLETFKSRGQTSLGFRIPLKLDHRLRRPLTAHPELTKHNGFVAASDLILTQCETANGGPFPSGTAEVQPASKDMKR